jgi:hypothetical protein
MKFRGMPTGSGGFGVLVSKAYSKSLDGNLAVTFFVVSVRQLASAPVLSLPD